MPLKTIFAVSNNGDRGKTETLRNLAQIFLSTYTVTPIFPVPTSIPASGDFRLIVEIKGKIIAIESTGDPNSGMQERLDYIHTTYNPDVLICACRTSGQTVDAINTLSYHHGYEIVWDSTYEINNPALHSRINQIKAEHIHDLLLKLGCI